MRPLLIGQAPGPNTNPELPLYPLPQTSAGGRLQGLTGLTYRDYLATFDRVNLLPYFPGQCKRDDKFPMTPAKLAAQVTLPHLAGRHVILVGRNVANAFLLGDQPFHEWYTERSHRRCAVTKTNNTFRVVVVPHPSGRNHWYNNPENKAEATRFWRALLATLE